MTPSSDNPSPSPATAGGSVLSAIDEAIRRDDMAAAIALARRAIEGGLRHPLLFHLRAVWHEHEGRFAPAAQDILQALAFSPGDARLLNALARCRSAQGHFIPAAAAADAALAADPQSGEAAYNLAFAREQMGQLDQAQEGYARARRLAPGLTDATARLAALAARRGDHAAAHALADEVLAAQPRQATALLAHIVSDLADQNFTAAERRARAIAGDAGYVPLVHASALSFLGDALDGQGRTGEAFAAYSRGNALRQAQFAARFTGVETGRVLAARLLGEFSAIAPGAWAPQAAALPPPTQGTPVFLIGFPRTGTTLLGQILASHSRVTVFEERPLLRAALAEFIDRAGGLARLAALDEAGIAEHRARFWERASREGLPLHGKLVVDQTPLNTLHLPVIAKLFPEARLVFAVRDPRDVVLGCFRRVFAPTPYLFECLTLEGAARFYDSTMRLWTAYRAALGLPVLELRNEDLVADFDGQVRALCDFLGLAPEDAMRDFARRPGARPIATPSAMQVTRGITGDGIGHWRQYEEQMSAVAPVLADWVERFGYA